MSVQTIPSNVIAMPRREGPCGILWLQAWARDPAFQDLTPPARSIMAMLAVFCRDDRPDFSANRLAELTGLCRRTVGNAAAELEAAGVVQRHGVTVRAKTGGVRRLPSLWQFVWPVDNGPRSAGDAPPDPWVVQEMHQGGAGDAPLVVQELPKLQNLPEPSPAAAATHDRDDVHQEPAPEPAAAAADISDETDNGAEEEAAEGAPRPATLDLRAYARDWRRALGSVGSQVSITRVVLAELEGYARQGVGADLIAALVLGEAGEGAGAGLIVEALKDLGPLTDGPAAEATRPSRPPWCGVCDERTRQIADAGNGHLMHRCPDCHPLNAPPLWGDDQGAPF